MSGAAQLDPTAFPYEGVSPVGQRVVGTVHAVNRDQAYEILQALPLRSFAMVPAADESTSPPNSLDHILPEDKALDAVADGMLSRCLAKVAQSLAAQVRAGRTAHDALQGVPGLTRQQRAFLLNSLSAGGLASTLSQLDSYEAATRQARKHLYFTLAYPVVLLGGMVAVISVVGHFVIPHFAYIFADFRTSLPALTEWCIVWSGMIPAFLLFLGGSLATVLLLWVTLGLFKTGRRAREYVASYCPLWGTIWRASVVARWCHSVALALEAGHSPVDSIAWAGGVSPSALASAECFRLVGVIRSGRRLDQPIRGRMIGSDLSSAISLGTASGDLPATVRVFAKLYEVEFESRRATLPFLVPVIIGTTGVVLFMLIMSMFLPLVMLIQSVSGGS
jgi:type II secretory pathway component PulF